MNNANVEQKWKWEPVSYQVADTGDYDGEHRFSNGKITLISRVDHEKEVCEAMAENLNNWPDLYCLEHEICEIELDAVKFDFRLAKEENERLKALNTEMLEAIQSALRVKDLWQVPKDYHGDEDENSNEIQALALMQSAFESAIQKATQP